MTFVAGIDMGAKSTKALILDGEKRVCGKARVKTRPDFHAVANGFVSVTPLQVDLTRHGALEGVREWLKEPVA